MQFYSTQRSPFVNRMAQAVGLLCLASVATATSAFAQQADAGAIELPATLQMPLENDAGTAAFAAPSPDRYGVPAFLWLPMDGAEIGIRGEIEARADTDGDGGTLGGRIFAPLTQGDRSAVMLDLGGNVLFDDGFDKTGWQGFAGLVARHGIGPSSLIGLNAYLEAVQPWDGGQTMYLGSLGGEFEHRFAPGADGRSAFVQLGANVYLPFADYTDDAEFGEMDEVLRTGADAFASIGRSFDGFGLRGTATAFTYGGTDTAEQLTGYAIQGDVEWHDGLPDNTTLVGTLGFRDDNRDNVDPEAFVGLRLNVKIGGPSGHRGTSGMDNGFASNDVTIEPARRHLGFGSPLTPVEYKPVASDPGPQCTGGQVLDPSTNQCVQCTNDAQCVQAGTGLACNLQTNTCVGCTTDLQCQQSGTGALGCNLQTNTCVRCTTDLQCIQVGSISCNLATNSCEP